MARTTRTAARNYGWRPDLPDMRDRAYTAPLGVLKGLPQKVDLRPHGPPVVNQGRINSCTGNAIAAAHYFDQIKQKVAKPFQPSRLFIYYNERLAEGSAKFDAGAYIRDGFKAIGKEGVCPETTWPYDPAKVLKRPVAAAYKQALAHQAISYMRVQQTLGQLKGCLADGYPFVFGFTVYSSFESDEVAKTGVVPLPTHGDKSIGGHAVMAMGYDDARQRFIVQNSWGRDWGVKGFFYMPYSYLTDADLAADFWTMRTVEA